jgi:hypothetical protein
VEGMPGLGGGPAVNEGPGLRCSARVCERVPPVGRVEMVLSMGGELVRVDESCWWG